MDTAISTFNATLSPAPDILESKLAIPMRDNYPSTAIIRTPKSPSPKGSPLIILAFGGGWISETAWGVEIFTLDRITIAWGIIIYGFIAAVLPVWLLLAPRDYLSTFMKIGTIIMLAVAIVIDQMSHATR